MSVRSRSTTAGPARTPWAVLLVLLHLFVAPCATAMVLMPADADCEHCLTSDGADACVVASDLTRTVIGGLAFDSGRAEPPLRLDRGPALPPAELTPDASGTAPIHRWSRTIGSRHGGDPPLYLVLGQLRL